MNTIKFTDINELSTERHDPNYEPIHNVSLFGHKTNMMVPTNLNILIGYECNCKCDFCIINQSEKLNRVSDEFYLEKLEQYLKELKGLPYRNNYYWRRANITIEQINSYIKPSQ